MTRMAKKHRNRKMHWLGPITEHVMRKRVKQAWSNMGIVKYTPKASRIASMPQSNATGQAHMIPGVDGKKVYGFPNSIITTLRYVDNFQLTCTTGAMATQFMAANGIYDPDITGSGHQPLYRDTYAAIYDQYVVLGSKITVSFITTTANEVHIIGICGEDDASASSTFNTRCEQSNSTFTQLGYNQGGGDMKTLTGTFGALENLGVEVKDDGYSATAVGSNPSELWCWAVWAQPESASTTVVKVLVEVEYTVKFSELQTPVQS